jgi:hypothetical protein
MKSTLRLLWDVVTNSLRPNRSSAPIMATFFDCPGAGTRRSAPRLAHARAKYGCLNAHNDTAPEWFERRPPGRKGEGVHLAEDRQPTGWS